MEREHKHKYNRRQLQCRQCGKLSECQEALMIHISKYHKDLCSNQKGLITENIRNCSYINRLENNENLGHAVVVHQYFSVLLSLSFLPGTCPPSLASFQPPYTYCSDTAYSLSGFGG
jgi:hypothetical protein